MSSVTWDAERAGVYDDAYAALFEPSVLDPMTGLLAELARGGSLVEFAVGTGRVALALSARGIAVHGIELSRPMAERLSAKPGAGTVPVTTGDMRTTRVPGTFTLVYLVANTIMNVTTQDDQPTRPPAWNPADASSWRWPSRNCAGSPRARPPGSLPSTTSPVRSRGRITGSRRTDAWCATPRPTATSGRPNST